MTPRVVLLAPSNDAHAGALDWALRRNGVDTLWQASLRGAPAARLSLSADSRGVRLTGIETDGVSAVWYRSPQPTAADGAAVEDREFVASQWRHFEKNVFDLAHVSIDALWVNAPAAAEAAESKLLQLHAANAVGLRYPEIAASNDVAVVRDLRRRCGKLIFKPFAAHAWRNTATGDIRLSGVVAIDEEMDLPDAAIALCPGLYQRYIDKACDVRVTMMGDRLFAVRILRRDGKAYLDWRPHLRDKDLLIEPFELTAGVTHRLHALMRQLGLVFGGIDLVIDRDGIAYFLEVNQRGQFLFVEQACAQVRLLQAMTSMLICGRSDYSLDAGIELAFSDYLQSDDYRRLLRAPRERRRNLSSET